MNTISRPVRLIVAGGLILLLCIWWLASPDLLMRIGRRTQLTREISESPEFGAGYYRGLSLGRTHATLGNADLTEEQFNTLKVEEEKRSGRPKWSTQWRVGFALGFKDGMNEVRVARGMEPVADAYTERSHP